MAAEVLRGLWPALATLSPLHQWAPVTTGRKTGETALPPGPLHLAELARRESWITLGSGGRTDEDRPAISDDEPPEGAVYCAPPFVPNPDCWDRLYAALLTHDAPVLVSAAVAPTRLAEHAKGRVGKTNSSFLGMILAHQMLRAALARPEEAPDFSLYVDEFQNVATPSFAEMLSEARKYGLAAVLANQYCHQVSEGIRRAILGNVGSLAAFRLGPEDAALLEPQFLPAFDRRDLMNLPVGRACVSLLSGGVKARPFTMDIPAGPSRRRREPPTAPPAQVPEEEARPAEAPQASPTPATEPVAELA